MHSTQRSQSCVFHVKKWCLVGEPQRSFYWHPLQPHHHHAPRGIAAGTLCVLTAKARCPGAVCLHGAWDTRVTMHTCGHHGPTSCFNASSMCLLGFRVVREESSAHELAFNCLSKEARQQSRRGKRNWGSWGVLLICTQQLDGKCTRASHTIPNPQGQQD